MSFWTEKGSPIPIALYRILWGLLVAAKLLLLKPDWLNWFGVHGWTTVATLHKLEPGLRFNLFSVLPQSDAVISALFWVGLASALCVAAGLFTRPMLIVSYVILVSLDERNIYAINAGDSFLRIAGFFLIFSPAGKALSLDRIRRGTGSVPPQPLWPQRMIQFLTCLLYFITAWWKASGETWLDGTALYYVHHLDQFRRFPVPGFLEQPLWVKFETWSGLAIEFALGGLLWFRPLRYWLLGAGVLLHLSLEYSMNIPLFQFILLSTYVLFIDPEDLERVLSRAAAAWPKAAGNVA